MKRLTSELDAQDVASQVRAKLQRPRTSSQPHAPLLGLMRTGLTDEAPQVVAAKEVQAAADRWNLTPAASSPTSLQPKRPATLPS